MKSKFPWKITTIAIIIVSILWVLGGGLAEVTMCGAKRVESITALFSGLAFAGMMIAIYLQSKELSLQRRELELTRKELHRTAEANEKATIIAGENLKLQDEISRRNNSYIKNQIVAQRYIADIEFIYKEIEYSTGSNINMRQETFKAHEASIKRILNKFKELKTIDGPIS